MQSLEHRLLLSAGDLDTSFVRSFTPDSGTFARSISAVAAEPDGKVLALYNAGSVSWQSRGIAGLTRYNADGTPDGSFPFITIPSDNRFLPTQQYPVLNTLLVEPDGGILVGGYLQSNPGVSPVTADFLLARVIDNNRLDTTFGDNGIVVTALPGNEQVTSLALAANGDLLAEGPFFNFPNAGFHVARYSPTGTLLNVVSTSLGSNGGQGGPTAMAVQANGGVVVGGAINTSPALWGFTAALAVDSTFGNAGVATVPLPAGASGAVAGIAINTTGQIVAAATAHDSAGQYGGNTYLLSRFNGTGAIDGSFGAGGVAWLTVPATPTRYPLAGVKLESDGKIVLAGSAQRPGTTAPQLVLRRFLATGAPDAAFHADVDPNLSGNGGGALVAGLDLDNFDRPLIGASVTTGTTGTGVARYLTDETPPGLSANYAGKPISINAYRIEAEDFDRGGEGVAYHDTTPQNSIGSYRPNEGVDIFTFGGNSPQGNWTNGTAVVDTHPGEWLQYTINVPVSAIYHLRASVADNWTGGQFHAEIDGQSRGGEVTVFGNGSTDYFDSDSGAFWIPAGTHTLRVVMDKAGPGGIVGAFDSFALDEKGYGTFNIAPFNIAVDTIEAENFNFNDYTDTTPTNTSGQYRPFEPVDINAGGSNGYSVGNVMKGEVLRYNIQSPTNSMYVLQARVASFKPGGTFHVEIDNRDVTGPMTVPDSGPWDTWTTITSPAFAVTPTIHVMRVVMDRGGFWEDVVGDIDYFKFIPQPNLTAPPLSLHADPARGAPVDISQPYPVQAEDYDVVRNGADPSEIYSGEGIAYHDTTPQNLGGQYRFDDGVDIIPPGDPYQTAFDFNFAVGYTAPGEWLQYAITVPTAGSYVFQSRVANLGQGGTFHMTIDGVNKTGTIAVPDTGGWYKWATLTSAPFPLAAGVHSMRIYMDAAGPAGNIANFDWFQFAPAAPANVFNGTSGSDVVTLSRDADGQHVNWVANPGGAHGTILATDPAGLTINGNGSSDAVILDYSAGNPLPATLRLNGLFALNKLQGTNPLAGTALDVGRGTTIFLEFADTVPNRLALVKGYLHNGYNAGAWTGAPTTTTGVITSTDARDNPQHNTAVGYSDNPALVNSNPTTILLKYAIVGDANLDGTVGLSDYTAVVRNFGTAANWEQGDFAYAPTSGLADYTAVVRNFGSSTPATTLAVSSATAPAPLTPATPNNLTEVKAKPTRGKSGHTVSAPKVAPGHR